MLDAGILGGFPLPFVPLDLGGLFPPLPLDLFAFAIVTPSSEPMIPPAAPSRRRGDRPIYPVTAWSPEYRLAT